MSNEMEDVSSGSDTDGEDLKAPGATKTSERKRQQVAIFEHWRFERARRGPKPDDDVVVNGLADELSSIQVLARKQESNVIISDPRDYQVELFERAKNENIIAVLDTGSGKTLIAVLLLRHIFDQELERRAAGNRPRLAFFLVDNVALVYQQFAVLECNLNQNVDRFSGDMNVDSWNKTHWDKHFEKNMAIVCTADILLNCLVRSYLSMDRINLLIFDEAHHTKKNHAYARIIKDFYLDYPQGSRPRIFGMTASPVDAKTDPVQAARELEAILHARIATTQNLALLRNCISRPEEVVIDYEPLPYHHRTPLCAELESQFGNVIDFARQFSDAKAACSELGSWCADQVWTRAFATEDVQKREQLVEIALETRNANKVVVDQHIRDIREVKTVVNRAAEGRLPPARDNGTLSSKVLALEQFLAAKYEDSGDTRCIVFVKRRSTARLLKDLFQHIGSSRMRHGVLIGTRKAEAGDAKESIRAQLLTLRRFQKGELNLLFATSVAEEGLDIPLCNSIIRFDLYETLIQYIQSRGRARHAQSQYIHMVERGNPAHLQALREVRSGERVLQEFCQRLPADRILKGNDDVSLEDMLVTEKKYRLYREPETGAKLTYWSATQLLSQFVHSLPQDSEDVLKPTYIISTEGKLFRCEAVLPRNSPIRSVIGRPYFRKAVARGSAAFEACLKLREKGYLDSYLKTTFHKRLPEMRNARLAITVKKTNEYDVRVKPQFWTEGIGESVSDLYVTVIDLADPCATGRPQTAFALLTRRSLPDFPIFPIFPRPGSKCDVKCARLKQPFLIDRADLASLTSFTLRLFHHLFNKMFERDEEGLPYWIAPVICGWESVSSTREVINWDTIESVHRQEIIQWTTDLRETDTVGRFIVDRGSGGTRYFTTRHAPDLRSLDPVPDGCVRHQHQANILQYSSSLWKKSRGRVQFNENQPVYEAYQIPHRRNWLDDWDETERSACTKAYICLEPLMISAIPSDVAEMGFLFPSIIWRLDSYLIASEACRSIGLDIPPSLALEAMTKDSDNTEEHRAEQIHFQRGMGRNYERLEFIGDCFLKMATSISLYAQNANDDEFESHVKRMVMICNRNLFNTAVELKVYEYTRTEGFNRRTWYPAGLKLVSGKGVNAKAKANANKHRLNDKSIADVCEALIGAALLTQRRTRKMDMAVKAVSMFVKSPDHNMKHWEEYYRLYKLPTYQTAESTASQQDLASKIADTMGYRFKYPRLLQAAFIHPSYLLGRGGGIPCYQRLEFLGDSLLDMACVNFLFFKYPNRDPQWLTEHKMAMVANKFLGALCVRLKFNKHLLTHHNSLLFQITEYVTEVTEAELESKGSPDYWTRTKDPPKCLPDIVEAYIGAIFVDSQFSYAVIEAFFEAHVRPYFENMTLYDSFANAHPTTYLGHVMDHIFHCNHWRVLADELVPGAGPDEGQPPTIVAVVMVHFHVVADSQGTSGKYAKIRASQKAVAQLEQMNPVDFKQKFGCNCVHKETQKEDEDVDDMAGTAV